MDTEMAELQQAGESSGDGVNAGCEADADADDGVFLVPYQWWREAQRRDEPCGAGAGGDESGDEQGERKECCAVPVPVPYAASTAHSYTRFIAMIISSELVLNLRRHDPLNHDDCRALALLPTRLWFHAMRRHKNGGAAVLKDLNWPLEQDIDGMDVYPLMLKMLITGDNTMTIKISKKDQVENYRRALKIFSTDSDPVYIWDFSGQANLVFMNEWNKTRRDSHRQSDQETLLKLHVYEVPETSISRTDCKKDLIVQQSNGVSYGSYLRNGSLNMESDLCIAALSKGFTSFGLSGLENLGNTCFMNSAIQCLAHTTKLVSFFLKDYAREINRENPLGMHGELALAFGELLRKLCSPDRHAVAPKVFKGKLAHFSPQFSGFNQHDSQELLAFLLDGLHEDLNRVKHKPYVEAKDAAGRPDEEVADEYWSNHLARNDSIIVDLCQGQYRSTLVCPVCSEVSITFDPFMYLSLPLPSAFLRTMTITVFNTDGTSRPSSYTISVHKYGKCKDLIQALSMACALKDDERLLVAEVFSSRIIRYLEEPSDSLSLIRDGDRLVAYRLPKDSENSLLIVFVHQRMEEHYILGKASSRWKAIGVPLLSVAAKIDGSSIYEFFMTLLSPLRHAIEMDGENEKGGSFMSGVVEMGVDSVPGCDGIANVMEVDEKVEDKLQFYLTNNKCQLMLSKIESIEQATQTNVEKQLHVLVCWQDKIMEQFDMHPLNCIPEVYRSGPFVARTQDPITFCDCLETFLKKEPLGPEDMWYCPNCKTHQQASKKLDLWRLPEVLVIHLKRFSYSRYMKSKLETFVDFPIQDFDLSSYVANKTNSLSQQYVLYAIINHYGSMGGGHYTAYIYNEAEVRWYEFDDRHVNPISEDRIKSSAAYVLFFRRVETNSCIDAKVLAT